MRDIDRRARRYSLGITALVCGGIIFWITLRCNLADWHISETHADIIYTGLRRFGEFPFFSFVFNGGSYFLQDPQSNLFSPAVPLILLAGPSVGLRLMEGVWAILGVYTFALWMRRHVSFQAALLGAVAIVLSLGMLWRVTAGNDMFLWHLGLPLLLYCVERVMAERTLRSAIALGLALGVLLLGPTFHSFVYLFLPAVPVFVILGWAFDRPSGRAFAKTLVLIGTAFAIALAIASPKLVCWLTFPMRRQIVDHGVLSIADTLRGLFDYRISHRTVVPTTRYIQAGEHLLKHRSVGQLLPDKLGMEECAAALPPLASLFALAGVISGLCTRAHRRTALFALFLIACGAALCCSWPVWSAFRALTKENFRVAPRYLGIAAFGLSVLAALGAEALFTRFRRAAWPVTVVAVISMWGSAVWWTLDASHVPPTVSAYAVRDSAFNPLTRYREERDEVARLSTFSELNELDTLRPDILKGSGLSNGFLIVGNDFKPNLYRSKVPVPIVSRDSPPTQVIVEHTRIKLFSLPPHARLSLRVRAPAYGMVVRTMPVDARVEVRSVRDELVVENRSGAPVNRVVIRAQLPISALWFVISAFTLLGAIAALILLGVPWWRRAAPWWRRASPSPAATPSS